MWRIWSKIFSMFHERILALCSGTEEDDSQRGQQKIPKSRFLVLYQGTDLLIWNLIYNWRLWSEVVHLIMEFCGDELSSFSDILNLVGENKIISLVSRFTLLSTTEFPLMQHNFHSFATFGENSAFSPSFRSRKLLLKQFSD